MGLFDGPPVTDAQRELVAMTDARTREWYLEAEIAMLNMRIVELEAALKPFDEELKNQELEVPHVIDGDSLIHNYGLRLRDFHSARAALEKKND